MPWGRKPDFAFFRSWQNTLVFHGVKQEANCGYESSECTDAKVIICNSKFLEEAPTVFGVFSLIWARIWVCQIWSSGISPKRSCKIYSIHVDLLLIGPPCQKLRPNIIFRRYPHCKYNVKLESDGHSWFFCGIF